jgi:hypothetical protein
MPEAYLDSAGDEVKWALAEIGPVADGVLSLAWDLEVKLPATRAMFRDGLLRHSKVQIIARKTALLDPGEARQAEALVLGRARTLSPAALRHAIALAVGQIAPEKAKKEREHAARNARVERWREDSGNAGLAGRELPAAHVVAMDQRITWWARELRAAGVQGSMDLLRARALTDLLLNQDSRPVALRGTTPHDTGADHPAGPYQAPGSGPGPVPGAGLASGGGFPGGFAIRNHLTTPVATLLGLADRPGLLEGLGPVDPWLARDLATASAAHPRTTWCLTVTDTRGRAVGHACARPEPRRRARRRKRGPPGRTRPPGTTSSATSPRSGTQTAPPPCADAPPATPTSSTTSRTKPAAGRVCATAAQSVGMTISSSKIPAGKQSSTPTAPSPGRHRPAASTPPSPPATPSNARLRLPVSRETVTR